MPLRHELKRLLDLRDISQRSFAQSMGKSPAWVSRVLRGSLGLKSFDEVLRIAEVLGCDAQEADHLGRLYLEEGGIETRFRVALLDGPAADHEPLLIVAPELDPETWAEDGGEVLEGRRSVVGRVPGRRGPRRLEEGQPTDEG